MAKSNANKKRGGKKLTIVTPLQMKVAENKSVSSKKVVAKIKQTCFVTIPFMPPFDLYYETIYKPAIRAAELAPVRADDLFRPSPIVSDFWKMIKGAAVVLAELTTKNANVFYELGLSHAIGKPVVLISETMNDVPFDLQQLRVLLYNKDNPAWGQKLSSAITASLKETLDKPDETIPPIFKIPVETFAPEQNILEVRLSELEQRIRRFEYALVQPHTTISHEDAASIGHLIEMARADLIESKSGGGSMTVGAWFDKWENKGLPRNLLNEVMADYFIALESTPDITQPESGITKTS